MNTKYPIFQKKCSTYTYNRSKDLLNFFDGEIEKQNFSFSKSPTTLNDIDINKIIILGKFFMVIVLSAKNMIKLLRHVS